jgi:hypothetical protein
MRIVRQVSQSSSRDLKLLPPEYEAGEYFDLPSFLMSVTRRAQVSSITFKTNYYERNIKHMKIMCSSTKVCRQTFIYSYYSNHIYTYTRVCV